jgi:hypothetical protein
MKFELLVQNQTHFSHKNLESGLTTPLPSGADNCSSAFMSYKEELGASSEKVVEYSHQRQAGKRNS